MANVLCHSLQSELVESQSKCSSLGRGTAADGKGDGLDNTLLYARKRHMVQSTGHSAGTGAESRGS